MQCGIEEHQLIEIIGLTICALICNADSWVDLANYGKAKADWLKGFLGLAKAYGSA